MTDGMIFSNRFGLTGTEVLFDRICRDNGINHLLTALAIPTRNGKIERFTRVLTARISLSLAAAQRELGARIEDYNIRPPSPTSAVIRERLY